MTGLMRHGSSKGRSMAGAFAPMSRRFSCPSFDPAISSSWITSAARSKAVRQLIRSVGAKLFFLPKYSPDLNPIEQVFAKLKHLLRKAAARTVDAVCAAIGHALDAFSPEECANYLKNSGYRT
jgi:DDE superfamily endonuclease